MIHAVIDRPPTSFDELRLDSLIHDDDFWSHMSSYSSTIKKVHLVSFLSGRSFFQTSDARECDDHEKEKKTPIAFWDSLTQSDAVIDMRAVRSVPSSCKAGLIVWMELGGQPGDLRIGSQTFFVFDILIELLLGFKKKIKHQNEYKENTRSPELIFCSGEFFRKKFWARTYFWRINPVIAGLRSWDVIIRNNFHNFKKQPNCIESTSDNRTLLIIDEAPISHPDFSEDRLPPCNLDSYVDHLNSVAEKVLTLGYIPKFLPHPKVDPKFTSVIGKKIKFDVVDTLGVSAVMNSVGVVGSCSTLINVNVYLDKMVSLIEGPHLDAKHTEYMKRLSWLLNLPYSSVAQIQVRKIDPSVRDRFIKNVIG